MTRDGRMTCNFKSFSAVFFKYFSAVFKLPYFFGYKTVFFFFQDIPKNLDPSYKMDLDLWDC